MKGPLQKRRVMKLCHCFIINSSSKLQNLLPSVAGDYSGVYAVDIKSH